MKKIYLHIGAHKTASSYLQTVLRDNIKLFQSSNISIKLRSHINASDFFPHLQQLNEKGALDNELDAINSFKKLLPKNNKMNICLWSNEDLFKSLGINDFYDYIDKALKFICDNAEGFEVFVILYTRNQVSYMESVYTQFIHVGRSFTFKNYLEIGDKNSISWLTVCSRIESVIGRQNLIVKPFETIKELGSSEFFLDFVSSFSSIDCRNVIDAASYESEKGANRSFSDLAIQISRKVQPLLSKDEKELFRAFLQTNFSTATHPKTKFFSEKSIRQINSQYKEDNEELFSLYMPSYDGNKYGYYY